MAFLIHKFTPQTKSSDNSSTPSMDCTENPSKSLGDDDSADTADSVLRLQVNTSPQQNAQEIPRADTYANNNSAASLSAWNKKFGGNDGDNIGEVLSIEAPVDKVKSQLKRSFVLNIYLTFLSVREVMHARVKLLLTRYPFVKTY